VAAVAPRGYMLLCLLDWDGRPRPVRGLIADRECCRTKTSGLIRAQSEILASMATTQVESAVAGSSVADGS
jgi:hypothetical protein